MLPADTGCDYDYLRRWRSQPLLAQLFGYHRLHIHELSHIVVIATHGRRVGRLGTGLYFGGPCIYVDNTAAGPSPTSRIRRRHLDEKPGGFKRWMRRLPPRA